MQILRAVFSSVVALLLTACGGGGDSSAPAPTPPAAPSKASLTTANYKSAATISMSSTAAAFEEALIGLRFANRLFGQSIVDFLFLPCSDSGSVEFELTERNRNHVFEQSDELRIDWNQCRSGGETLDGLMRIEVVSYTPTADGYEMQLTVTAVSVSIAPGIAGQNSSTLNFIAPMVLTHGATSDHIALASGVFRGVPTPSGIDVVTAGVDLVQDYAANRYELTVFGRVDSDTLGGQLDFANDTKFTGTLGNYPDGGRLALTGGNGSMARLAEEGAAAGDPAAVLATVDTNGDGLIDASDESLGWATVMPLSIFESNAGAFD